MTKFMLEIQQTLQIPLDQFTVSKNYIIRDGIGSNLQDLEIPLIFVKPGVKISSDFYINEILNPAARNMKRHFKNSVYTFQQDGAPSHTSKKSQVWCKREFPKFWSTERWPPASPDLNPMDFSVWPMLEAKACSVLHTNIGALKKSLNREWANIPQENPRACAEGFRGRIESVVRVKGDHFEICTVKIMLWYLCFFLTLF